MIKFKIKGLKEEYDGRKAEVIKTQIIDKNEGTQKVFPRRLKMYL